MEVNDLFIEFDLEQIDKAGATVLFEDPKSKGNNIGVVVNPVRISSLTEFGSIDIVADKLLQAEKKKVCVKACLYVVNIEQLLL